MNLSTDNLSYITARVKNIPYRLKRELYKLPILHDINEQFYQKALKHHAQFLPPLDGQCKLILSTLRDEGTCIVPIEELELSSTKAMMTMARVLADKLNASSPADRKLENCEIDSHKDDLREFTEILLWALEPKLLDLIENYIGLPILYQGFAMGRSIADGRYSGVRRWHIDWEDRRIIKIIVYLNDVAAGGGPYEYIPREITSQAIKTLNYYNLGYLSDEEMQEAVPKDDWTACLAPKGSLVITDTSNVFHRAQPPTVEERLSITFCYTSANPQVIWRGRKISSQQWQIVDRNTSKRQKSCLHKIGLV
jgi:hypothetical protein